MSSKPPIPPKSSGYGKQAGISSSNVLSRPRTVNKSSPYFATLSNTPNAARRVQSANTVRNTFSTTVDFDRTKSV